MKAAQGAGWRDSVRAFVNEAHQLLIVGHIASPDGRLPEAEATFDGIEIWSVSRIEF